jgi:hypothetical protein
MTLLASLFLFLRSPALATVSTNVPLDDISYFYMEKLVTQGLVKSDLRATRPFSRFEMARLIVEARTNWAKLPEPEKKKLALIGDLLQWLENRYREEIEDITGVKKATSTFFKPIDRVSALYRYQSGPYPVFNNQGLDFYDGSNAELDFTTRGRIADCVGLFLQPRFYYYGEEDARNEKGNQVGQSNFDLLNYYVKLDIKNTELEVGRDSLWWGPAQSGDLIMSDNAEPFPIFKLSNPVPTVLPGIFDNLGLFKYSFIFATLDSNRLNPTYPNPHIIDDYDNPYLGGMHLDFKPRPWFEFGFNLITAYGGNGHPVAFLDNFKEIFFNTSRVNFGANSEASMFWNLRFNDIWSIAQTLSFYGEWGVEDFSKPGPDKSALQFGLSLGDFLKWEGRLQLTFEWTQTVAQAVSAPMAWYTHPQYPMTYDGRIFGDHVGTDGKDFYASLSVLVNPQLHIAFDGDYEISRITLENGERILLGQVEATYFFKENLSLTGSVGFENLDNAGYVAGDTEHNSFLSLQFRCYF